ncbi:glycosyl hydrolase family 28-related protein [Sphingobacterium sp. BN32]|uniref:glycosyl hydrolase family 28-related protein n=1 Tax=Sphingobacterium sp. BN32 TaxID=3058432 RepID=UPI00265D5154|nr:glycosyl hydrolase family 28-related protein [Sphingobacterium sp. BN32]WKK58405.1 glycosyl hydrolase family 28-related protein [Sphingobacterium sp. BN32]
MELKKVISFYVLFLTIITHSCAQNKNSTFISVVDYGAKPAKNWTSAVDNSAAIQKAIDNNPGKMIFIPSGIYLISKEINIKHGVRIVGEDKYSTILQSTSNNTMRISAGGVTLEKLFFYGQGNIGLSVINIRNVMLTDLLFQNVDYGIMFQNVWNAKLRNVDVEINSNQNPKVKKGFVFSGQCVNNHISDSQISAMDIGIEIQKSEKRSEGLMLSNVLIYGAKTGLKSEGALSLQVNNCIIDLCEEYAIQTRNTAGLLVSNSWLYSKGNQNTQAVKLYTTWDSHFSASNIKTENGNAVILIGDYSNNNIFSNCTIEVVNSNTEAVVFEQNTKANLLKDNNFKSLKNKPSTILNRGISNKIIDNSNTIIK